jgi:NAD-dependent dihydropyrimidine dehydrogenase PreA subunit
MDTKKFYATDNCTACGLCAEICNTKNIAVDSKPAWGNNCVQCFACINRCPEEAIQYGNHTQTKGAILIQNASFLTTLLSRPCLPGVRRRVTGLHPAPTGDGPGGVADAQVLIEGVDPYFKKRNPVRFSALQDSFYTLV